MLKSDEVSICIEMVQTCSHVSINVYIDVSLDAVPGFAKSSAPAEPFVLLDVNYVAELFLQLRY